jgi:heat shock protein HslJ
MTLAFEGRRAAGSDGCNRFTVPTASSGADLRFPARPATTLMACPDDQRPRADAYLRALGETRRYRMSSAGRLELLDAGGQVVATFAAQSQALAGTRWEVTGIHDGRQAVVSLVPGSRVTLAFDAQGRVSGTAGCNRYTTRYEDSGGRLRIDAPAATRMACPDSGVMAQEQAFLRALEAARTARIEADSLELRDDNGALQVDATRLPPGR